MHIEEIRCSLSELYDGHGELLEKTVRAVLGGMSDHEVTKRFIKPVITRLRRNNRHYSGIRGHLSPPTVLAGIKWVAGATKAISRKGLQEKVPDNRILDPMELYKGHDGMFSATMVDAAMGLSAEEIAKKHIEPIFDEIRDRIPQECVEVVRASGHELDAVYLSHMFIDMVYRMRKSAAAAVAGPDPTLN